MTDARPLVIGYGNPLREDDGLGWRAAELLAQQLPPGTAEIIQRHQLTPELAAEFDGVSVVLFLDAACDQPPGAVSWVPVCAESPTVWSHSLSPGQLLGIREQLGGNAPPAFLVRGGIQRMDLSEGLTETGEKTAIQMASVAHTLLRAAFTLV